MLYVVLGIVAVLIIGWLAMRFMGSAALSAAGVDADRNLDGSVTYSNEEGSVTVGGNRMPDNWPSDAPENISGATIQYSGNTNPQTGEAGAAVVYTARGSAQSVADYYKGELESNGWTISATAAMGGATVVSAEKEGRTFGAYIADNGDGTVTVTAGLEL